MAVDDLAHLPFTALKEEAGKYNIRRNLSATNLRSALKLARNGERIPTGWLVSSSSLHPAPSTGSLSSSVNGLKASMSGARPGSAASVGSGTSGGHRPVGVVKRNGVQPQAHAGAAPRAVSRGPSETGRSDAGSEARSTTNKPATSTHAASRIGKPSSLTVPPVAGQAPRNARPLPAAGPSRPHATGTNPALSRSTGPQIGQSALARSAGPYARPPAPAPHPQGPARPPSQTQFRPPRPNPNYRPEPQPSRPRATHSTLTLNLTGVHGGGINLLPSAKARLAHVVKSVLEDADLLRELEGRIDDWHRGKAMAAAAAEERMEEDVEEDVEEKVEEEDEMKVLQDAGEAIDDQKPVPILSVNGQSEPEIHQSQAQTQMQEQELTGVEMGEDEEEDDDRPPSDENAAISPDRTDAAETAAPAPSASTSNAATAARPPLATLLSAIPESEADADDSFGAPLITPTPSSSSDPFHSQPLPPQPATPGRDEAGSRAVQERLEGGGQGSPSEEVFGSPVREGQRVGTGSSRRVARVLMPERASPRRSTPRAQVPDLGEGGSGSTVLGRRRRESEEPDAGDATPTHPSPKRLRQQSSPASLALPLPAADSDASPSRHSARRPHVPSHGFRLLSRPSFRTPQKAGAGLPVGTSPTPLAKASYFGSEGQYGGLESRFADEVVEWTGPSGLDGGQ